MLRTALTSFLQTDEFSIHIVQFPGASITERQSVCCSENPTAQVDKRAKSDGLARLVRSRVPKGYRLSAEYLVELLTVVSKDSLGRLGW